MIPAYATPITVTAGPVASVPVPPAPAAPPPVPGGPGGDNDMPGTRNRVTGGPESSESMRPRDGRMRLAGGGPAKTAIGFASD